MKQSDVEMLTVEEIKKTAKEIAKRHGVEKMFLFGSYARGDARNGSDLDFYIEKGRIRGLFALGGLYADLEEAFGMPLDLLTAESLSDDFKQEISNEEVLIYEEER